MNIKELRNKTNMTQKDFAEYFSIPVRTLQDWEQERRTPPSYLIELIEYKIKKECLIMLDKKIEQLKKLAGEEFTLLEMDNTIQEIIGLDDKNSIFDGDTEDYLEREEFSYVVEDEDVNIKFNIIEENEDLLETIIEVVEIEEL